MTTASGGSGFRRFALAFYAAPGVEAALIALQDEAGQDVILMLYGLWRAGRGEALAPEEARKAADLAGEWTARATQPLRALRRAMKQPFRQAPAAEAEAARREVKALELAMEMRLIAWLEAPPAAAHAQTAASGELARRNLRLLGEASGRAGDPEPLLRLWEAWREA